MPPHPNKGDIGNPAQIWSKDLYECGVHTFLPLKCRCASYVTKSNTESIFVVIALAIQCPYILHMKFLNNYCAMIMSILMQWLCNTSTDCARAMHVQYMYVRLTFVLHVRSTNAWLRDSNPYARACMHLMTQVIFVDFEAWKSDSLYFSSRTLMLRQVSNIRVYIYVTVSGKIQHVANFMKFQLAAYLISSTLELIYLQVWGRSHASLWS